MDMSELPDAMEQLPDSEMLACVIFRMLDEGAEQCLTGINNDEVISTIDLALMLCDSLRSQRLKLLPSQATIDFVNCTSGSLAIYRASHRV